MKTYFKNEKPLVRTKSPETITFKDKDGLFVLTVRKAFLRVCPNPSNCDIEDLVVTYNFNRYLHSINGPAVIYCVKLPFVVRMQLKRCKGIKTQGKSIVAYWYNGDRIDFEKWDKLRKQFV